MLIDAFLPHVNCGYKIISSDGKAYKGGAYPRHPSYWATNGKTWTKLSHVKLALRLWSKEELEDIPAYVLEMRYPHRYWKVSQNLDDTPFGILGNTY